MKKYIMMILWDDGDITKLGTVESNDPKLTLFNKVSELIVTSARFYDPKNPNNIWEGIKEGQKSKELGREHYYYEANNNVVSIMETR